MDLIRLYHDEGSLRLEPMGRGFAWLDTGTHEALSEAGTFIEVVQKRQGLMIACPEEIALRSGWIAKDKLLSTIERLRGTDYARYLEGLL